MATYDIATGDFAVHGKTLVTSTVDTITVADFVDDVTVIIYSGTSAPVYVTTDGSTPSTSNAKARVLLPGERRVFPLGTGADGVVKVVSASAAVYSIEL